MSETENTEENPPQKSYKMLFIVSIVIACMLGTGSYLGITLLLGPKSESEHIGTEISNDDVSEISFIPLDPITVSLESNGQIHHLRFRSQLEVPTSKIVEVDKLKPRVIDILNSFLRALDFDDIKAPSSLAHLRGQMLRRVKIVLGHEYVNDLLVMEFVVN